MRTSTRIHGLDAVRAGALLLGVLLHATMSFLPGPQIWVVADAERSVVLSVAFFAIHVMRMTVFFVIAGFFGRMTMERKGAGGFLFDRARRIGLPLVLAWPAMFVTIGAVASLAAGGALEAPELPRLSLGVFPLMHLWFLWLLLMLCVAAACARAIVTRVDRRARIGALLDRAMSALRGPWGAPLLALPVALALYLHAYWFMWFGIPTPDQSLVPQRAALVTYGLAFALGWTAQRDADAALACWTRDWPRLLAVGVTATVGCLALAGVEPLLLPAPQGLRKLVFALAYALALWSLTFATLGVGLRFLGARSGARRYLADASYWIYLAHLPLVMALQWLVASWALPWTVKLAFVLAAALGALLLCYDLLVRPTFVGAVLNGRRYPSVLLRTLENRMVIVMRALLLLFVLPAALSAQSPAAPAALPLDSVLARYQAALGPFESVRTRRSEMRVSGLAPFEIPVVIEAMRPGLIRKDVTIQGSVQVTAFDGRDAWRVDPFVPGGRRPMDLPAADLADLLEEADFDGALVDAAAKGNRLTYAGPAVITVDGRRVPVHSIAVSRANGRSDVIHLDARSFLEVRRVLTRPAAGRSIEITITPGDYRTVSGIPVPHALEIAPEGMPEPIRVTIDRVAFNVPLDAARFARPAN